MIRLDIIACEVGKLKPGERLCVAEHQLRAPAYEHNGGTFTGADQVLEKIVGSAYRFRYREDHINHCVVFERLPEDVEFGQAYVSPDRRERFKGQPR